MLRNTPRRFKQRTRSCLKCIRRRPQPLLHNATPRLPRCPQTKQQNRLTPVWPGDRPWHAIWAWRLTDGIAPAPPPFVGVAVVGAWRPTPLANAPGAGPQFASMTPWVLSRPSQFRLPPPLALNSPEYAADLNELKVMGIFSGSARTPDQSELALFWAGNTPLYWNRIAAQISAARGLTLTENAHLFAL